MTRKRPSTKSDLFIVDNSDSDWKVKNYLLEWCEISKGFDIATGFFEIGALLSLGNKWQNLDKIRILMGDEVSRRTKKAFEEGLGTIKQKLDNSIEDEKIENDFLDGVSAIVDAIKNKKIECRVYKKKKFHAKSYITHSKLEVVGSSALVGSSNFTNPGLSQNVELNIQVRREVERLQDWYEKHWKEAEDITPEILKTIERHTKEFTPFEIYSKSLYEYFKGHELTESEWELKESKVYPILDQYQKEGYQALMKIASRYNGAFLCDGVGLGKTFVGLMLIERLLMREKKRVVLLVPKSGRKPVWEAKLKKYVPEIMKGSAGGLIPFKIINHTDLLRMETHEVDWPGVMEGIKDQADVIIIDEAHHFRNRNNRYRMFYDMAEGKQLFLLTATPVNNSLLDLLHQIELFSREYPAYFSGAPLGIHALRGHFLGLESALKDTISTSRDSRDVILSEDDAQEILANDDLLKAIVVQRSRSYVKESQVATEGREVLFPKREDPEVVDYSLIKTYGKLLVHFKKRLTKRSHY
jgi:DNA or RNA helicases of superfamily II